MRRTAPLLFGISLLLAGCGNALSPTLQGHLQNPLFAEYYYDDLVEQMVQLVIDESPLLDDERKKDAADRTRREALELSKAASALQEQGRQGHFVPADGFAQGEVLLLNGMLSFHPEFITIPQPSMHVLLSNAVDPRDVDFPDDSAVDIGPLQSPYGDQSYVLPANAATQPWRTAVLWDTTLGRLVGFAQLSQ